MSVASKMTAMANSIRALLGLTGTMGLDAMVTHIGTEKTNVDNALAAIVDKGVEVPAGANSGNLAELIASITGGGGGFPNGTEWTQSNISSGGCQSFSCVGGLWLAGTDDALLFSEDGKTWQVAAEIEKITSVLRVNGTWYATSLEEYIWYSNDGKTWDYFPETEYAGYLGLAYGNGVLVAISDGYECYYYEPGGTWTEIADLYNAKSIIYACNKFFIGLNDGLYYSVDGKNYTKSNINEIVNSNIVYGDGVFVVGTRKGPRYSLDGITWNAGNLSTIFAHVAYGDGLFTGTAVNATTGGLWYSEDGATWVQSNIAGMGARVSHNANGVWVCGSKKGLWFSLDGKAWEISNFASTDCTSVYNANGMWVAGEKSSGGIYYSVGWEQS